MSVKAGTTVQVSMHSAVPSGLKSKSGMFQLSLSSFLEICVHTGHLVIILGGKKICKGMLTLKPNPKFSIGISIFLNKIQ